MNNDKYIYDKDELDRFPLFLPNESLNFTVGDLYQTKQDLVTYELGEIASINNLLAGSYLTRKSFHEEQIESSLYEEEEYEFEKSTKTSQSSQQMMSEVSRSKLNQSNNFSAGGDVSGSYGTMRFNTFADSNNNQTRQQSRETAKEFATQVVNESEEKVSERRLRQAYSRNLEIIRKEEEYGFDNRGGNHVVGIKCFLNEVHKITVLNHKKYLFSTIMVAHPSEWYKKHLEISKENAVKKSTGSSIKQLTIPKNGVIPKELIENYDALGEEETVTLLISHISNDTWQRLAFHFGISSEDLPLPPDEKISIVNSLEIESTSDDNLTQEISIAKFSVPEGYIPTKIYHPWTVNRNSSYQVEATLVVNDSSYNLVGDTTSVKAISSLFSLSSSDQDNFHVAVRAKQVYDQAVILTLECEIEKGSNFYKTWQIDFYNALKKANQSSEEESLFSGLDNLGVGTVDFKNNPTLAKQFIQHELQRCVFQQIFGTELEGFSVINREGIKFPSYPDHDLGKLSKLSPLLTYLNSVFDFEKMTYRFLPNYLGAKWNRKELLSDTPVGPLKDFMEASFAQMILPVAKGMEHRFRYFMLTNGMVFEGEDVPVIDDEISLSVLDELEDDPSMLDEAATIVSESYIKLPSAHIMLMEGAKLPAYIDSDYPTNVELPTPVNSILPKKGESDVE